MENCIIRNVFSFWSQKCNFVIKPNGLLDVFILGTLAYPRYLTSPISSSLFLLYVKLIDMRLFAYNRHARAYVGRNKVQFRSAILSCIPLQRVSYMKLRN